jgi:hypothetical protein
MMVLSIMVLSIMTLSMIVFHYWYAQCHNAECRCTVCHHVEFRGAKKTALNTQGPHSQHFIFIVTYEWGQ